MLIVTASARPFVVLAKVIGCGEISEDLRMICLIIARSSRSNLRKEIQTLTVRKLTLMFYPTIKIALDNRDGKCVLGHYRLP